MVRVTKFVYPTYLVGLALALALIFDLLQPSPNRQARPQISSDGAKPLIAGAINFNEQEEVNSGLSASSVGRPARLKIPAITVDAAVEYVGLTPDGAMDVPGSLDEVGWYEPGQRPGESGSAVITGHYGRQKNGGGSVFDDLSKLRQGDKLYVEDEKGVSITFVVRESRSYDPNADASDVFGSSDGQAHLNLITCEGDWNEAEKSYSKRLVVFTDPEIELGL